MATVAAAAATCAAFIHTFGNFVNKSAHASSTATTSVPTQLQRTASLKRLSSSPHNDAAQRVDRRAAQGPLLAPPAMDAATMAAVGSRHGSINEACPYPATITEGFLATRKPRTRPTACATSRSRTSSTPRRDDPAGNPRGQYPDLTYLVLRVNDDESSDLTAAFADSHRRQRVPRIGAASSCKAGKSRSVSLVVHHLVADGATLADAWRRRRRGPRRGRSRLSRAAVQSRGAAPRRRADHRRDARAHAGAAAELAHGCVVA